MSSIGCVATENIFPEDGEIPRNISIPFRPVIKALFVFLENNKAVDTALDFHVSEGNRVCIEITPLDFEFCLFTLAKDSWESLPQEVTVVDVHYVITAARSATLRLEFLVETRKRKAVALSSVPLNYDLLSRRSHCHYTTIEKSNTHEMQMFRGCWAPFEECFSTLNNIAFDVSRETCHTADLFGLHNVISIDDDYSEEVVVNQCMLDELKRVTSRANIKIQYFKLDPVNRKISFGLTRKKTNGASSLFSRKK